MYKCFEHPNAQSLQDCQNAIAWRHKEIEDVAFAFAENPDVMKEWAVIQFRRLLGIRK